MRHSESFGLLEGEMGGRRLIANVDFSLRKFREKGRFPWFLSLSTTMKECDPDGMPAGKEAEALDSWEDDVEAAITTAAEFKFVGRVTWNGHRELIYHLHEPAAAASSLQRLIDSGTTRPFAFRCERDECWSNAGQYLSA
jgi:hypothetical protein